MIAYFKEILSKLFLVYSSNPSFAPSRIASVSIPAHIIGNKPTAVKTENLPPISSGTQKVS